MNPPPPSVCLAILNYNGVRHLESLLPTVNRAVQEFGLPCPVVVLDNQSSQGDVDWLARCHPKLEVVVASKNDLLFSYNELLARRREQVVVLLNNDLRLSPGFLRPLLRHFSAPDVFAVGATSRDWDDTHFTCGPSRLQHHHGLYHWDWDRDRQVVSNTLFTSGGFMAVDRKRFLELGGFNRLFWPGYGEDLDLCFRAWRKGWRCLFEPASRVFHREGGTFGQATLKLMLRAQLLFQWSTLPAAAWAPERAAIYFLTAARRLARGESWWALQWLQTYREWKHIRPLYSGLKVAPDELAAINTRIRSPLASGSGPVVVPAL